jgi:methylthioribose-1-phosphate isomerase
LPTVAWDGTGVRLIDQTRLPQEERYLSCRTAAEVARAISEMVVRGAPAIGAAAAYGTALAALEGDLEGGAALLRASRPTARDLFWAVDRVSRAALGGPQTALEEAHRIARDSIESCRRMGALGAELVPLGARVVTICNTGALATVDYGTGLGVVRAAHEAGLRPLVYVMETRPRAQGARLTTWELDRLGIPHRLIADSAAGRLLQTGGADLAISGADRICANGDLVNKVGTYPLALLCREHRVPFYAAAPLSTFDLNTASGAEVEIEERDASEVTTFAPPFDVTPAGLVSAIVTERGVLRPPYERSIPELAGAAA